MMRGDRDYIDVLCIQKMTHLILRWFCDDNFLFSPLIHHVTQSAYLHTCLSCLCMHISTSSVLWNMESSMVDMATAAFTLSPRATEDDTRTIATLMATRTQFTQ